MAALEFLISAESEQEADAISEVRVAAVESLEVSAHTEQFIV